MNNKLTLIMKYAKLAIQNLAHKKTNTPTEEMKELQKEIGMNHREILLQAQKKAK